MPAAKNAAASSHKNSFILSPLLLYNMLLPANKSTEKYFTCYSKKDILVTEKVKRMMNWRKVFLYLFIALVIFFRIQSWWYVYVEKYNDYPISVITRKFGDYDKETGQQYLYGGNKTAVEFFCSLVKEWQDVQIIVDNEKEITAYSKDENIQITLVYPKNNEGVSQILIKSDNNKWFPYNSNQIINFKVLDYHIDNPKKIMGGKQETDKVKVYIEEFKKEQKMSKEQMSAFINNNLKSKNGN